MTRRLLAERLGCYCMRTPNYALTSSYIEEPIRNTCNHYLLFNEAIAPQNFSSTLAVHCVFLIQPNYDSGAEKKPWAGRVQGGGRLRPRSANTALLWRKITRRVNSRTNKPRAISCSIGQWWRRAWLCNA